MKVIPLTNHCRDLGSMGNPGVLLGCVANHPIQCIVDALSNYCDFRKINWIVVYNVDNKFPVGHKKLECSRDSHENFCDLRNRLGQWNHMRLSVVRSPENSSPVLCLTKPQDTVQLLYTTPTSPSFSTHSIRHTHQKQALVDRIAMETAAQGLQTQDITTTIRQHNKLWEF